MNVIDKYLLKNYKLLMLMLALSGFVVVVLAFFLMSYMAGTDVMDYANNPWIRNLAKSFMVLMVVIMVCLARADQVKKQVKKNGSSI